MIRHVRVAVSTPGKNRQLLRPFLTTLKKVALVVVQGLKICLDRYREGYATVQVEKMHLESTLQTQISFLRSSTEALQVCVFCVCACTCCVCVYVMSWIFQLI